VTNIANGIVLIKKIKGKFTRKNEKMFEPVHPIFPQEYEINQNKNHETTIPRVIPYAIFREGVNFK